MRGLALWLALVLLAGSAGLLAADEGDQHPGADANVELAALESAVRQHPDDADLVWSLAMALDRAGQPAAAVDRMAEVVERWPNRRPDTQLEYGRLLFEAGRAERALPFLDRALARSPGSGPAHFYRGLSLRTLGRIEEAHGALRVAARISPALQGETLLLRGLDLMSDGREEEALVLIRRAMEIDPTGETAKRARLLLPERERLDYAGRWFELDAYTGIEWDSNVLLDSGSGGRLSIPTNAEDHRYLWGAGATFFPLRESSYSLSAGYRYDEAKYDQRDEFDFRYHSAFLSGAHKVGDRATLRLDGVVFYAELDDDPYLLVTVARSNLLYNFGRTWGTSRIFFEAQWNEYDDDPLFEALERDSFVYGPGIEHYLEIPWRAGAWGSLGLRFNRADSRSVSSNIVSLEFGGDYDFDEWAFQLRGHVPLVWKMVLDPSLRFSMDRYENDNLIGFLDGAGSRERRDNIVDARIAVMRPIHSKVEVEFAYRYIDNASNLGIYDYDRHIVGLTLRVSTD